MSCPVTEGQDWEESNLLTDMGISDQKSKLAAMFDGQLC